MEYIERESLLKKAIGEKCLVSQMKGWVNNEVVFETVHIDLMDLINSVPSADVAPVRHGRWVFKRGCYKTDEHSCSLCGQLLTTPRKVRANYCPNCGAKMDLEADNG